MPHLLRREFLHRPRQKQPGGLRLRTQIKRPPLQPACGVAPDPLPADPPAGYWRRQALREGLLAALVTSLLTSAVHAAPQLFSQAPERSLLELKGLLLGRAPLQPPVLLDCP